MSNTGFFAKIKDNYQSKFSQLNISSGSAKERDGDTEDDTLIHNAFIKYFDNKNEEYPDWLGANAKQLQNARTQGPRSKYDYYKNAEFKPVEQNNRYNNSYQQQQINYNQTLTQPNVAAQNTNNSAPAQLERPAYQSRGSRLLDMHNKSRQSSTTSYNSLPYQPARTNSTSLAGSRLRERMLNTQPGENRASWGRENRGQ